MNHFNIMYHSLFQIKEFRDNIFHILVLSVSCFAKPIYHRKKKQKECGCVINTHCTPIKFSKYYPATNGKAGGQTTKKVKEPLYKTYEKGDDISYRLFRI